MRWLALLPQWTWVWVNSGSWWWTGRPGVLRFMGSQRVGHDWATELNWTEPLPACSISHSPVCSPKRGNSRFLDLHEPPMKMIGLACAYRRRKQVLFYCYINCSLIFPEIKFYDHFPPVLWVCTIGLIYLSLLWGWGSLWCSNAKSMVDDRYFVFIYIWIIFLFVFLLDELFAIQGIFISSFTHQYSHFFLHWSLAFLTVETLCEVVCSIALYY